MTFVLRVTGICICAVVIWVLGFKAGHEDDQVLVMRRKTAIQPSLKNARGATLSLAKAHINADEIISRTSAVSFGCVSLDWWPTTKCDYGRCAWGNSSLININLDSRRLQAALRRLSPVFLRLGGSLSDLVRYQLPDEDNGGRSCDSNFHFPTNSTRLGFPLGSGCLQAERWEQLNRLCTTTGCSLTFTINGLAGRRLTQPCPDGIDCLHFAANHSCCTSWEGDWDGTAARRFLQYTRRRGLAPWGFALGNELVGSRDGKWGVDQGGIEAHLTAEQYSRDFCELSKLVQTEWPELTAADGTQRPRLIAPDGHFMSRWFADFLRLTRAHGCSPDVIAYHQYLLGAGNDEAAGSKALDPAVLDRQRSKGQEVASVVRGASAGAVRTPPEVWMGEAGGAYNSGAPGVTDRFHSSFWYLDSLGQLARAGHHTFCRQTLVGGNYGLLNTTTLLPNPDYYALLLWLTLMGRRALGAVARTPSGAPLSYLRAYAHCTRRGWPERSSDTETGGEVDDDGEGSGDVTLLLINLHERKHYSVDVLGLGLGAPSRVEQFVVSAETLSSHTVLLNGTPLRSAPDGEIPPIGRGKWRDGGQPVSPFQKLAMAPHTYGFFVLHGASAPACARFGAGSAREAVNETSPFPQRPRRVGERRLAAFRKLATKLWQQRELHRPRGTVWRPDKK